MIDIHSAAKLLGHKVIGGNKTIGPGPSRRKGSTSLVVTFGDKYPDGFAVHSFSGRPWQDVKDYVRQTLGMDDWKPSRGPEERGPAFVAKSFEYFGKNERGQYVEWHKIDHMSDGTTRPYHWKIDGWEPGLGDKPCIPYECGVNYGEIEASNEVWLVHGEWNADVLSTALRVDGWDSVATTYPTLDDQQPDASFLFHLSGKKVHVVESGTARGNAFARKFAKALGVPVVKLPSSGTIIDVLSSEEQRSELWDAALNPTDDFVHDSEVPEAVAEAVEEKPVRRIKRTKWKPIDPKSIRPREWLYGTHLIRRYVSLTAAPGGLGKTSIGMVDAMSIALGRSLYPDMHVHGNRPRNVWYWNGEDDQDENVRRTIAAAIGFNIDQNELAETFAIDTGREMPMTLLKMGKGEVEFDESLFVELEQMLIEDEVEALFLDPLVSIHEANENDNGAMGMLIKRLSLVAERANCAIEIVHHVRKPGQGPSVATSVNDARGAGALLGGVRSARVLNVMDTETAELCQLSEEERLSYVCISDGEKANMSAKKGSKLWRKIEGVALENGTPEYPKGDNVAVVKYFELPDAASDHLDMTTAHEVLEGILKRDTSTRPKIDGKAAPNEWLGYKLLGRLGGEIQNKEHIKQVERFLKTREKEGDIVTREAKISGKTHTYYALPWQVEADNVVPITGRPPDDDKPFF